MFEQIIEAWTKFVDDTLFGDWSVGTYDRLLGSYEEYLKNQLQRARELGVPEVIIRNYERRLKEFDDLPFVVMVKAMKAQVEKHDGGYCWVESSVRSEEIR